LTTSAKASRWRAAVQHLFDVADGAQADPGAAGFVAGREAPAADFAPAAVRQQRLADAAGADRDDGAGLAAVGAHQGREAVGFEAMAA
jgi:hypothetical protein